VLVRVFLAPGLHAFYCLLFYGITQYRVWGYLLVTGNPFNWLILLVFKNAAFECDHANDSAPCSATLPNRFTVLLFGLRLHFLILILRTVDCSFSFVRILLSIRKSMWIIRLYCVLACRSRRLDAIYFF
jgi:hypothetical protein